jgi:deazaflavin-dependent oxidoreductase (nitroreductase family)
VATIAATRPDALDGPIEHVGPVLGAVLLVLRATINRLNRWLMVPALRHGFGPWLATPIGGYILLLESRGRRTGLLRQAPLSYRIADGSIWVIAGFGPATLWYRNLVADPAVRVRLPGRELRCRASTETDPAVRRRMAPALVRSTGIPGLLIGCNPWTTPDERILAQLEGVPLIRLDPVDGPIRAGPDDPGGRAWLWRQGALALVAWAMSRLMRTARSGMLRVTSAQRAG